MHAGSLRLPDSSLAPFKARKLRNAKVVYRPSGHIGDASVLEEYAYVIPSDLECQADFDGEELTFYAERYGGAGTGLHGGGVRCGIGRLFQVKGIGSNLLRGEGTLESCFWHAHGGVTLAEAVQEAAWSEVFQQALPYGAVRVHSIVLTGTDCWYEGSKGERLRAPRALLVRDPVIRPAHFERATYFRPEQGVALCPDVERVRAAIFRLPSLLPHPPGDAPREGAGTWERLVEGLHAMAHRFAIQCAAAQSKRLMHGALNASNIGIDGRWLDFGTATSLPSHANTKSYGLPPHLPTLWEEQNRIAGILANLSFYVHKYFPGAPTFQPSFIDALTSWFSRSHEQALTHSYLMLAGFLHVAKDGPRLQEYTQLGRLLMRASRLGVERRFVPGVADLGLFGESKLGNILRLLCLWHDDSSCPQRLLPFVSDLPLASELAKRYHRVMQEEISLASLHGICANAVHRAMLICALKAGKVAPHLYRNVLRPTLDGMMNTFDSMRDIDLIVQRFVDDAANQSKILYRPRSGNEELVWKSNETYLAYDMVRDGWHTGVEGSGERFWSINDGNVPGLSDANKFYGVDVRALLAGMDR